MKAVIFSPFSNIWEHAYPEALFAKGLETKGWDIEYVQCNGALQAHCVAMSAAGISDQATEKTRKQVCVACHKRREFINSSFGFSSQLIEKWLVASDWETANKIIEEVGPETWTELSIDDVPLGRYAAYEMWLHNKLMDTHLDESMWAVYRGQLLNTLLTYFAAKKYLQFSRPDVVIVYNDRYSVNHAFCAAAENAEVSAYMIHGGWHMVRRGESLTVMRSGTTMAQVFESVSWKESQLAPLNSATIDLVEEHFRGLWEGSSAFAYSSGLEGQSATELRNLLGIAEESKVALAAMSSLDEILGVQLIGMAPPPQKVKSLFRDQLEWVKHLITFARNNSDTHIVIRLHPRMFPNKRELQMSPVVEQILKLQENSPSNVTFNVPDDNIGLYDLAQIVDVLLNYSSTVGAELMALGIPTVVPWSSYFYTYPNELNLVGKTTGEYDNLLRNSLDTGWSLENSRKAFRWFGYLFTRVAAGFSETVSARPTNIRPKKPGFRLWLWRKAVYILLQYGPMIRERLSMRNRELPDRSVEAFNDILTHKKLFLSDSEVLKEAAGTMEEETEQLFNLFKRLSENEWSSVTESNSLAGRVRTALLNRSNI